MITEFDIDSAIAECQGVKNPNAKTCIMLAAFLTIKKEYFSDKEIKPPEIPAYSFTEAPQNQSEGIITYQNNTEFSQLIEGKQSNEIWAVMDYLMSTLQALNPRLYNSVLSKIEEG